ncbi:FAD/NAD(P)-binding protein [Nocardioides luteus]|uniref:FAD/NAD(P)-binding protein n=1 Tax=Nocardioides luteus TaxID=1844 RepID=UPI001A1EAE6C|nr:FAD-dependent oxidoreductase [Nocardioides luteus]MBG6094074.1 putative NAD(P)/FAD-binding protein YdhS [Nocardioides luteus]
MTTDAAPPTPTSAPTVAIIGGGASGTLTAINLLRRGASVTLFESRGEAGYGVAYSTTDARHLLNVRANNMSGFLDDRDDLLNWAAEVGIELGPIDFLPRRDYSRYLRDRLAQAAAAGPGALETVGETVVDVEPVGAGFQVLTSDDGEGHVADAVVLAYGNPPPQPLAGLPEAPWNLSDPWDVARISALPGDATVLVVGTGLTAVDTTVTLLDDSPARRVIMVSRHGLLPNPHVDDQFTSWVTPIPDGPLTADGIAGLVRDQIEHAAALGVDWRAVIDGLRGPTQSIWRHLPEPERRRFRELYAREWEVRRHRMAPRIAALLDTYRAEGRLEILGGGVLGCRANAEADGAEKPVVTLADGDREVTAVVNCTGPSPDITRTDNPLLLALQKRGLIAPDPLRLGIDVTEDGRVIGADGSVVPGLVTVGPPCKGALYEATAIPEIRVQAAAAAAHLAAE